MPDSRSQPAAVDPAAVDHAEVHPASEAALAPAPAATLPVLYLDAHLAVVDKPAGLMAHDSRLARGETDFVADRLRAQFGRPVFLIHRLDRATSGCLLVAFDRETASALGKALMREAAAGDGAADERMTAEGTAGDGDVREQQMRQQTARIAAGGFEKTYWAICRGWPAAAAFTVDHALDGGPGKPQKRDAVTQFRTLATCELALPSHNAAGAFPTSRYAWLEARPQTGRFRQIRRHLKHVSHHLIGDSSHGDGRHNRAFRALGIHRMLLHARALAFDHPQDGRRVAVEAPVDAEFAKALALFGGLAEERIRGAEVIETGGPDGVEPRPDA